MRRSILGNGGFTELSMYRRWQIHARTYVREVRRYAEEIGRLEWAAPMDWMTEAHVLARTGASLRTHQRRTVDNFLELKDLAPDLPFIPVLQGQTIRDYHHCADLYEHHGVQLADQPLVGLGSVCRRQHSAEVEAIVRSLTARVPHLHAFGAKTLGLHRFVDAIASSDSAAWSLRGRYVPGCSPSHRRESNCLPFALRWRDQMFRRLGTDGMPPVDPGTDSSASKPTSRRLRAHCRKVASDHGELPPRINRMGSSPMPSPGLRCTPPRTVSVHRVHAGRSPAKHGGPSVRQWSTHFPSEEFRRVEDINHHHTCPGADQAPADCGRDARSGDALAAEVGAIATMLQNLLAASKEDPDRLLTVEELAELFKLSPRTLKDRAAAGAIAHHRFGKHYRFSRADITEILSANEHHLQQYPTSRRVHRSRRAA